MKQTATNTKTTALKTVEPKKKSSKRGMFGIMKGKIVINGNDEDVFNLN